jgi:hypothetical protein
MISDSALCLYNKYKEWLEREQKKKGKRIYTMLRKKCFANCFTSFDTFLEDIAKDTLESCGTTPYKLQVKFLSSREKAWSSRLAPGLFPKPSPGMSKALFEDYVISTIAKAAGLLPEVVRKSYVVSFEGLEFHSPNYFSIIDPGRSDLDDMKDLEGYAQVVSRSALFEEMKASGWFDA